MVLLFWCRLTQVVLEKRPLNECSSVVVVIGSRAPLSSKRPLLSVGVSVCLSVCLSVCHSVRYPRPFTHFRLTDLDETWQLGPTLAQTRCFEVSATGTR